MLGIGLRRRHVHSPPATPLSSGSGRSMDEIDVLNETEQPQTRRQVRPSSYEVPLGPQPADFPFEAFRAGLKAALIEDADLQGLGKTTRDEDDEAHAPVAGIAVDGPVSTTPQVVYRVRIDFG